MSKEAARLFIEKIDQNNDLQELIINSLENQDSSVNLVEVGREHGFEFTEEEIRKVWSDILKEEELSDFALELISGGVTYPQADSPAEPVEGVPPRTGS